MVRTKGMVRNVFLLGVFLALIITTAWLLLRGSDWADKAVIESRSNLTSSEVGQEVDGEDPVAQETVSGVLSIFNEELVFASSEFILTPENFAIDAEGFNLSLLGNPALRVENQYPTLDLRIAGSYVRAGEELRLQITEVTPLFQVREDSSFQPLPADEQERLRRELVASGITVPTVQSTQPYLLTVRRTREEPVQIRSSLDNSARFVFVEN